MNTHLARTVAAATALTLVGTGLTATTSHAAGSKSVALRTTQYPRLMDRSGAAHDAIRLANVAGVTWSVDGTAVTFADGETTHDVPVTAGASVTLAAAGASWTVPATIPTTWTYAAPSTVDAPPVNIDALVPVWNDQPGDRRDSVTLPRVAGIDWAVADDGTSTIYRSEDLLKDTVSVPVSSTTTVTATLAPGSTADVPLPTFGNPVTDSAIVAYTAELLDAHVSAGENPHDSVKGFGPLAGQETVRIVGTPGVQWKVGSSRLRTVSGVAYLPVASQDIDENGEVTVKAFSGSRSYTVPVDYETKVSFHDEATIPSIAVSDADVTPKDAAGTQNDTLVLKGSTGMTWWVGQERRGVISWAAQRVAKNGLATYRVRHESRADDTVTAKVYVKAVANRGYVVDDSQLDTTVYEFNRTTKEIPADDVALDAASATLTPYEGVTSWTLAYPVQSGTRTIGRILTVKAADIAATGAASMTYTIDGITWRSTRTAPSYTFTEHR